MHGRDTSIIQISIGIAVNGTWIIHGSYVFDLYNRCQGTCITGGG